MASVDSQLQRDVGGAELKLLLQRAHLPVQYPKLSPENQAKARLAVLRSWYDVSRPHILCTDTPAFLAALFLWNEFYIKPAPCNFGIYHFPDALNKYDMVEMVMSPPLDSAHPSCSVCTATRRMGKTQTLAIEMMPMMAITRPFTSCLISEVNNDRTMEEIVKMKSLVEDNEIIHQDFGGPKVLFNPSDGWSKHELKFTHLPNCIIKGHSLGSAQRGRGPIYGVIDDPEDESTTVNKEWREWFFSMLFNVYKPMFGPGGKFVWIGTPIHAGSCLSLAMRGQSELQENRDREDHTENRFRVWRRRNFAVIQKTEDGGYVSMQPARVSVEDFLKQLALDPISARKEILCEPVTPGYRVFPFDEYKHGFMHCREGSREYMLDLYTGREQPWAEFMKELKVGGAGDLADGQSETADYGAVVFSGIDSRGTTYVLDCFQRRCFIEKLIEIAYLLAEELDCVQLAWEQVALAKFVVRVIGRYVDGLRAKGRVPPILRGIENAGKNKVKRIMTMRPLFLNNEIRFLRMEPFQDMDGTWHTPVPNPREWDYRFMLEQVKEYTDNGLAGNDDAVDTLEMCIRTTRGFLGTTVQRDQDDQISEALEKWKKVGLNMPVPLDKMPPKMLQQAESRFSPVDIPGEVVPYV